MLTTHDKSLVGDAGSTRQGRMSPQVQVNKVPCSVHRDLQPERCFGLCGITSNIWPPLDLPRGTTTGCYTTGDIHLQSRCCPIIVDLPQWRSSNEPMTQGGRQREATFVTNVALPFFHTIRENEKNAAQPMMCARP